MTRATLSDMGKAISVLDEKLNDAERAVQLRLQEHVESLEALRHAIISRDNIRDTLSRLIDVAREELG